jgi:hypothetical protein
MNVLNVRQVHCPTFFLTYTPWSIRYSYAVEGSAGPGAASRVA